MALQPVHVPRLEETLYHETLPNGLQVFLLPKPGYRKTYATFTTRFGSIDRHFRLRNGEPIEVPDGIAHFLEHKMFEEEDGDVFHRFSQQGASANAFTSFTRTAYLFSCTDKVKENLLTLLDFVQRPYFTDENVEKEKGIIGQEIRMYEDDPDWQVYFGLIQALYQRHPVRIDIAGSVESISRITKEMLYRCYETFYHPSNMLLFVVGQIDPDEVIHWVRENQAAKTFAPPSEVTRLYPEEPQEVANPERRRQLSVGVPKLMFGFKEGRLLSGDALLRRECETELAMEALFGTGSELYQQLYDENLIDDSFGYQLVEETAFAFTMVGGDTPDPERLLSIVKERLARHLDEGLSEETFERVRRKKIGQWLRSLNSLEFIANQFTSYRFNGTDLFAVLPMLERITCEDVNRRMREHLHPEQMAVSIVEPLVSR
ncbi:MAG: zinc protease [Bacillus thermozeamaize]|jgi:predicted Zn-dependent peptidase|uniref:Zinc protease n=1 Tax=Bacillus thermozeamaize TaxID=230954 RepID=A0A1Y3PQJ9_9BACI|nr:MAG: zinc protease [Bacillus thermozeamaize]